METILLIVSILLFTLQTISMKFIKAKNNTENLLIYTAFTFMISLILFVFVALTDSFIFDANTIIFGLFFGLFFMLTIIFYFSALSCGPLSYTAFYFSSSMLIPAISGIVVWGENFKATTLMAILFFIGSFYFISITDNKNETKPQKKWYLLCALTFICNGLLAVIIKAHQYKMGGKESSQLMLLGFFAAFIFYVVAFVISKRKENLSFTIINILKSNIAPIVFLAISSGIGNLLLTFLSGKIPSSFLFPVVQGSTLISITICSILFFKEKLNKRGTIGILLGVTAIFLINL